VCLRITFLLPGRGLVGGIGVAGEYAGRLRARGHQVTVAYRRPARNLKRWAEGVLAGDAPDALDRSGCPLLELAELQADGVPDADVLVATGLRALRAATGFPRAKGRLVDLVQGTAHLDESPEDARAVLSHPARRIAVSEYVAGYLKTRFAAESVVVPNGVDHTLLFPPESRDPGPRTVGMIWATGQLKGSDDALAAWRLVRERRPEVRLVIFGARRPPHKPPQAEVFVRPPREELRAIYGRCGVWMAPSHSEGFGLPVLEAMACGTVPVATRCGGHEEIVEDGVSGVLVPVGSPRAMAGEVLRLVEDETLLGRMAEAAYRRSLAFDWEKSTDRLEALLKGWVAE